MEFKDDTLITMHPKDKNAEESIIVQNAKHIRHHSLHSLKSKQSFENKSQEKDKANKELRID